VAAPHRPITTLLVANRGEIARRVFRTARALGIRTVAVHSDADATAPFVAEADLAVALPGNAPADTYLRIDLLLDAAHRAGADAVHPGYGFLAESAAFAEAVERAGLIWVGPPPGAIAAMGSKIAAKHRMRAAGVPVLPDATVGADEAEQSLLAAGTGVGYPLLVKASAGGGGRGMRVVRTPDELVESVHAATREAVAAFGDGTVFLERYVEGGRHVEIQVLADQHGACVSLHERECSIQRRHQKIVEECPSPAVTPALRQHMGEAAVAAARAVGYVGAGTVEFLLDDRGQFSFLEMNTRLQVEHPVTEMVTGLDLVALQLHVAEGGHLPPEALAPALHGHAIEVRLCAEEPAAGYRPSTGMLTAFELPTGEGLRVDTGVVSGSVISPFYDSMIAKIVAWAPTRSSAARRLADALERAVIAGVTTNRDQLVEVLRHPAFLAGETATDFLDRHDVTGAGRAPEPADTALALAAVALGAQSERRAATQVLAGLPSGWRNNPALPQTVTYLVDDEPRTVQYLLDRAGRLTHLSVEGQALEADLVSATPDTVALARDGVQRRFRLRRLDGSVAVTSPGVSLVVHEVPRFHVPVEPGLEGSLVAPMPGAVIRLLVSPGDTVTAGDVLLVLEAMKMEHGVRSPVDGVVGEVLVAPGQQVDAGQPLLVVGEVTQT
jgi:propionyl-CoA carboxylase alpha chain